MTDHNATVPMRRVRHSREFGCHGTPLTPALARLHDLPTLRQHTPVIDEPVRDVRTTGRFEERYARRIRTKHQRSWVLGVAVSVALGLLGLGVGYLFAAVAVGRV